jgi:hypothetical protein
MAPAPPEFEELIMNWFVLMLSVLETIFYVSKKSQINSHKSIRVYLFNNFKLRVVLKIQDYN